VTSRICNIKYSEENFRDLTENIHKDAIDESMGANFRWLQNHPKPFTNTANFAQNKNKKCIMQITECIMQTCKRTSQIK